jgi:hypothetical protein
VEDEDGMKLAAKVGTSGTSALAGSRDVARLRMEGEGSWWIPENSWCPGLPEWMEDALNEYARAHSEGYSDWTTGDFERLTGHSATHYEQFASDFARTFRRG